MKKLICLVFASLFLSSAVQAQVDPRDQIDLEEVRSETIATVKNEKFNIKIEFVLTPAGSIIMSTDQSPGDISWIDYLINEFDASPAEVFLTFTDEGSRIPEELLEHHAAIHRDLEPQNLQFKLPPIDPSYNEPIHGTMDEYYYSADCGSKADKTDFNTHIGAKGAKWYWYWWHNKYATFGVINSWFSPVNQKIRSHVCPNLGAGYYHTLEEFVSGEVIYDSFTKPVSVGKRSVLYYFPLNVGSVQTRTRVDVYGVNAQLWYNVKTGVISWK